MLRHIGLLILIYLGLVIQTSLIPMDSSGIGQPFIPAILLVVIALSCEANAAVLWSALLGLALDGLSMEKLGIQLTLASLLALGLQMLRPIWNSRGLLAVIAMILLVCVAWRTLSPMTLAVLGGHVVNPHRVFRVSVQDSAWTAVLGGTLVLIGRGLMWGGAKDDRAPVRAPTRSAWAVHQ